jgi:hypothetical protein
LAAANAAVVADPRRGSGHRGVTQADAGAWTADLLSMGEAYFFSVNRYLFLATKPA